MQENLPVQRTMALVNQRTEQFMWLLLVSMHWKLLWLMFDRDALSIYLLRCNALCCQLLVLMFGRVHPCRAPSSIFQKIAFWRPSILKWSLEKNLVTNWKGQTYINGRMSHAALYKLFSESNDTFATLSFANLVCSLPCWLKDCNNGQESDNEETLMSGSRNDLIQSCWDQVRNHV